MPATVQLSYVKVLLLPEDGQSLEFWADHESQFWFTTRFSLLLQGGSRHR